MTMKEMSALSDLKREARIIEERLAKLESTYFRQNNLTGMPGGGGGTSPTEKHALEAQSIKETLSELYHKIIVERMRLESYIAGMEDSFIRQACMLHFADGLTWGQTAGKLGGNNTGNGVRIAVSRYLHSHNH